MHVLIVRNPTNILVRGMFLLDYVSRFMLDFVSKQNSVFEDWPTTQLKKPRSELSRILIMMNMPTRIGSAGCNNSIFVEFTMAQLHLNLSSYHYFVIVKMEL